MIDIENLFNLNIGLVLAGGGAKGAYEAGVFKALWDLDIIRRITVVSGTSIGTINGLMLSMNDGKVMDESWSNISYSRFINNENKTRDINIKNLIRRDSNVDKEKGYQIYLKETILVCYHKVELKVLFKIILILI